jgi:glycosyltransferase involved in cell wall biosynthesis
MRIALVNDTFTRSMGYTENVLPQALVKLGHEVHVVAGNLTAYHASPDYRDVYEPFLGPSVEPLGVEAIDGFLLHRLDHRVVLGYPMLRGLAAALKSVAPDIVQTTSVATWITMQVAFSRFRHDFALFTGAHQTPSVLSRELVHGGRWTRARLSSDARRAVAGRLVARVTERCFAASEACADVAVRFYGLPRAKVEVSPIGSDTKRFRPPRDEMEVTARRRMRERLGFSEEDVVCIYTGRFTAAKDPLCLARAVGRLQRAGETVRGLFIGDGPQAGDIAAERGCVVRPFVPWAELGNWYRAADIGVWPRQESVSMLDAAACGLPIVASATMGALERVNGNGLTYREGDPEDLATVLVELRDPKVRSRLGANGVEKVRKHFSWDVIARQRAERYQEALERREGRRRAA